MFNKNFKTSLKRFNNRYFNLTNNNKKNMKAFSQTTPKNLKKMSQFKSSMILKNQKNQLNLFFFLKKTNKTPL